MKIKIQPAYVQKKSKAELAWERSGQLLLSDKYGRIEWMAYEPIRLRVLSGWYTPDFICVVSDKSGNNRLFSIEVKASKKQHGYRAARTKQKEAATLYPMFTFIEAMAKRGGMFTLEVIPPNGYF